MSLLLVGLSCWLLGWAEPVEPPKMGACEALGLGEKLEGRMVTIRGRTTIGDGVRWLSPHGPCRCPSYEGVSLGCLIAVEYPGSMASPPDFVLDRPSVEKLHEVEREVVRKHGRRSEIEIVVDATGEFSFASKVQLEEGLRRVRMGWTEFWRMGFGTQGYGVARLALQKVEIVEVRVKEKVTGR